MTTTEERLSTIDVLDRVLVSTGFPRGEWIGTVTAVYKLHFIVESGRGHSHKFNRKTGRLAGESASCYRLYLMRKATAEDVDRVAARDLAAYLSSVPRERWMGLKVVELRALKDRLLQADVE